MYKISRPDGEIQLDPAHITQIGPGDGDALIELRHFGGVVELDVAESQALARQDFDAGLKSGNRFGCDHCFFHGRRKKKGACVRPCCRIREIGLDAGVEVSPFVRQEVVEEAEQDWSAVWLLWRLIAAWAGLIWLLGVEFAVLVAAASVVGRLASRTAAVILLRRARKGIHTSPALRAERVKDEG